MRFACLALALLTLPARAGDAWVTGTIASYHFDRSVGYNEFNPGLGAQYRFDGHWRAGLGFYKNSFSRTSWYAVGGYFTDPVARVFGTEVRPGLYAGGASGYRTASPVTPAALGALSFQRGRYDVTILGIPKIDHKTSGLVTLQFAMRFSP